MNIIADGIVGTFLSGSFPIGTVRRRRGWHKVFIFHITIIIIIIIIVVVILCFCLDSIQFFYCFFHGRHCQWYIPITRGCFVDSFIIIFVVVGIMIELILLLRRILFIIIIIITAIDKYRRICW